MQSKEIGEKILKLTPFGTRVEGQIVVLTIGTSNVKMDYNTALKISAFLRYAGRLAKKASGDESKKFTVVADLTDGNAEDFDAFMSKDRKSVSVNRKC